MFAVASHSYLLFGSSSAADSAAIRLEEDLKFAYLGESETYANPPLVEPSEAETSSTANGHIRPGLTAYSFPIKELEVFCGARSVIISGSVR